MSSLQACHVIDVDKECISFLPTARLECLLCPLPLKDIFFAFMYNFSEKAGDLWRPSGNSGH